MRSEIRAGLTVLSEEGPLSFLREVLSYFYEIGYWSVHDSYAPAIRDTGVSFTAPNRTVVEYRLSIGDFGTTPSEMMVRFEGLGFEVEELQTRGSEVFRKAHT